MALLQELVGFCNVLKTSCVFKMPAQFQAFYLLNLSKVLIFGFFLKKKLLLFVKD